MSDLVWNPNCWFSHAQAHFRIIIELLNARMSVHVFYKVYIDSLLARTFNSRGNQFANISENSVLANISGSTVILGLFLSFFHNWNLVIFFGHFSEWIEGTLCAQLLLQFNTDTFETLHTCTL